MSARLTRCKPTCLPRRSDRPSTPPPPEPPTRYGRVGLFSARISRTLTFCPSRPANKKRTPADKVNRFASLITDYVPVCIPRSYGFYTPSGSGVVRNTLPGLMRPEPGASPGRPRLYEVSLYVFCVLSSGFVGRPAWSASGLIGPHRPSPSGASLRAPRIGRPPPRNREPHPHTSTQPLLALY